MQLGLSYSGFTKLIESLCLYLLPNLGSFQPLFLWILSSPSLSLLSFWDSDDTNASSCFIVSQATETLHFFSTMSLCCSVWVNSIDLFPISLILSSVISTLILSPGETHWMWEVFKKFVYCVFHFYNFYLFHFHKFYFFLLRFSIFSFVLREFIIFLLKHLCDGWFKILIRKLQYLVHLSLVVYWLSFLICVVIFLALGMTFDFLLYMGHISYYIVRH